MTIKRLSEYIKIHKNRLSLNLGEFVLTKQLGQGGNGLVYEANFMGKDVAIKFLVSESVGNTLEQKRKRFVAEYFNIITLDNQDGIVRYIDFDFLIIKDEIGEISIPVIIMKRYDKSLDRQPLNKDTFITLFTFLLNTVEQIHNVGIIHRDIKPDNILVSANNFFLADFGIASYNPEMFHLRAETERKERLGNRLFSAPEQEEIGSVPHSTMDIYAVGQVLQWYITGKTHRGTGRKRIGSVFEDLSQYDEIIDRCLENDPQNRFQTIQEIRTLLNKPKEKNIWQYIYLFSSICRSNFPKNLSGIIYSDNLSRIDGFLNSFKQNQLEFDDNIEWHTGHSNINTEFIQRGIGIWEIGGFEYKIKDIWIYYNSSKFNDFILIHHIPHEPFIIEGKKKYEAVILDDKYYISHAELQNGYAEIDDSVIELSKHKIVDIAREKKEGYFFIGTRFHCILQKENDSTVNEFISHYRKFNLSNDKENILKSFAKSIKTFKHPEVIQGL